MNISDNENIALLNDGEKPKVRQLIDALQQAINGAQHWYARAEIAKSVMWSVWQGQSPDGKKHAGENDERDPIPWDGASDTRIRLAAEKVIEVSAREAVALSRANVRINGREGLDHIWAQQSTTLLKWMLMDKRGFQNSTAARIGRFNRACYGVNIMNVEWRRDEKLIVEDVEFWQLAKQLGYDVPPGGTLPQLAEAIADPNSPMPPDAIDALVDLEGLFSNPERRSEAVDAVSEVYPNASKKRIEAALDAWQDGMPAKMCIKQVVGEYPEWDPMIPFEDVFFPTSTENLQDAPWIAVRELLTEAEVRRMEIIDGWDGDFVKAVLDCKGQNSTFSVKQEIDADKYDMPYSMRSVKDADDEDLCEIFYIYYRAFDDDGAESIYRLVASAVAGEKEGSGEDLYGKNEIYPSADGAYPFIEQVYWRDGKNLLSCVGLPWLLRFHQKNIKDMRDKRFDVVDISTVPSLIRDSRSSMDEPRLGPGAVIYEKVPGATRWMEPPKSRVDIPVELENSERRDSARLVGSSENGVPPDLLNMIQSEDIANYLMEMREVYKASWRLMQEFLPPVTVYRVNGASPKPYNISADEIRGDYDLSLEYDPNNLMDGTIKGKLEAMQNLLSMDRNGLLDPNFLVRYGAQLIDPVIAEMAMTDASQGQQQIALDEKNNITMMLAGMSAPLKQKEPGAQMRLQIIQQEILANPVVNTAYRKNKRIRAAFDQRIKNLNMQLMQQRNETIGKLGVDPQLPVAQ